MVDNVIQTIKTAKFEEGKIYLIEKLSKSFGLFFSNNNVYFGTPSGTDSDYPVLQTVYLEISFKVGINSIEKAQTFSSGNYDLLKFKGNIEDLTFKTFYSLCKSFSQNQNNMSMFDFFNTIKDLFQDNQQRNKTIIGLIGELIFIKETYEKYKINICDNWHKTGTGNSKFDFSFDNFNIEVKTSSQNESAFLLKHSQIFNNQKNYICVINLIETGTNYSIESLRNYFENNTDFSSNLNFMIMLAKQISLITNPDDKDKSYSLNSIKVFDKDSMPTITNIPGNISGIEYMYDFIGLPQIDLKQIL